MWIVQNDVSHQFDSDFQWQKNSFTAFNERNWVLVSLEIVLAFI